MGPERKMTPDKIEKMISIYNTTINDDICNMFGISIATLFKYRKMVLAEHPELRPKLTKTMAKPKNPAPTGIDPNQIFRNISEDEKWTDEGLVPDCSKLGCRNCGSWNDIGFEITMIPLGSYGSCGNCDSDHHRHMLLANHPACGSFHGDD